MTIKNLINEAVLILRAGGLVAMPTETVYGLAADARNPEALKKIFLAKQRPMDHPLIVHLAGIEQINEWASEIPPEAWTLAKAFWPGPLTLILKKAPCVSDVVTGGQDTIGLRIPNHSVARELLNAFGGGLAAPSANRFGRISPTTAQAVREELGEAVDLILEGGACEVGVESTIVDITGSQPVILRPGMISARQIEKVLHKPVMSFKKDAPRVSGSLELHYAPQTKTVLAETAEIFNLSTDENIALVALHDFVVNENVYLIKMSSDPKQYAHDLYQTLRHLDKKGFAKIMIEKVPGEVAWAAIQDRLKRATSR
jgi:L-threonylcarbamoyladenylate synthase